MSLILDALRKSEAERRRGKSPDLFAGLPTPTATQRPQLLRLWPWFALAALCLAAASVFWIAREADAPTSIEPAPRAAVEDPGAMPIAAVEPAPTSAAPAPTPTPMIAPTAAPPPAPSPQAAPANVAAMPLEAAAPAVAAAQPPPPPVAENESESLPPIAVLTASERASLPPLKLSMHVWDREPGKRFAIIDGHRIGEGAVVGNGVIQEIRRDGVVIEIDGRRILLPRP